MFQRFIDVLRVLKGHQHSRGPFVFCREDGTRLTYQRCRRLLMRACERAGIGERVQWHALRNIFASHLAIKGVAFRAGQELLAYAPIDMTMRYAHLTPDVTRLAVQVLAETDQALTYRGTIMAHQNSEAKKRNENNNLTGAGGGT